MRLFMLLTGLIAFSCIADDSLPSCHFGNKQIEQAVGFCSVVKAGDTFYFSGKVGQGEMRDAVASVYDTINKLLNENDLSYRYVVKENVFTTDMDALRQHETLRKSYYGDWTPAATWVQVERLYNPEFILEVEIVAVKGE